MLVARGKNHGCKAAANGLIEYLKECNRSNRLSGRHGSELTFCSLSGMSVKMAAVNTANGKGERGRKPLCQECILFVSFSFTKITCA